MKLVGNFYFPDTEQHFTQFGSAIGDYQRPQREKALEYVSDRRVCIDIGANVGIFSRHFAEHFERVIAIEPVQENVACLKLNVPDNVQIMTVAVGDVSRKAQIQRTPKNVGGAFICDDAKVIAPHELEAARVEEVTMITIDSLGLDGVGLMKLDIQGSELIALLGAKETMLRCKPVVLIEEKPIGGKGGSVDHIEAASQFLVGCGMVPKEKVGADRIYVFHQ